MWVFYLSTDPAFVINIKSHLLIKWITFFPKEIHLNNTLSNLNIINFTYKIDKAFFILFKIEYAVDSYPER